MTATRPPFCLKTFSFHINLYCKIELILTFFLYPLHTSNTVRYQLIHMMESNSLKLCNGINSQYKYTQLRANCKKFFKGFKDKMFIKIEISNKYLNQFFSLNRLKYYIT